MTPAGSPTGYATRFNAAAGSVRRSHGKRDRSYTLPRILNAAHSPPLFETVARVAHADQGVDGVGSGRTRLRAPVESGPSPLGNRRAHRRCATAALREVSSRYEAATISERAAILGTTLPIAEPDAHRVNARVLTLTGAAGA